MYTEAELKVLRRASRILEEKAKYSRTVLNDPSAVKLWLQSRFAHQQREVFLTIFVNTQHEVLAAEELFQGTIDNASVYPREVVKRALALNAAAVIFGHNHPSGVPEPSQADIRITGRLRDALALVDIRTLDHIIIGQGSNTMTSFAERGLL